MNRIQALSETTKSGRIRPMRTGFASPLGRLAVCLLAVVLCVTLSLPAQAITANHSFTSASAVAKKTAYTGVLVVVAQPCTGLFAADNPVNRVDPSGRDFELITLSTASSLGQGLENQYNNGVSVVGNSVMNTVVGVEQGYSIGQVIALNIAENAGAVVAGELVGRLGNLRKLPGVVKGIGKFIAGERWLRGSHGNAAYIPEEIAVRLAGRRFANFDEFRAAFWKLVGEDAELSRGFKPIDVARMKSTGGAPTVDPGQALNGRATYELHHIQPIQHGGGVYDLDNLIVTTPRYHREVLEPAYHY